MAGSQLAKVMSGSYDVKSFDITLPVSSLLSCNKEFLSFDKKGGTKNVLIMTEYKSFAFTFNGKESCDWIKVNHLQAHTESIVLVVSQSKILLRNCCALLNNYSHPGKSEINMI